MKQLIYFLVLSIIFVMIMGCSDDGGSSGLSDEEILALGWENFGLGNYTDAIDNFNELIENEAYLPEAYSGLGWSYSRFGQLQNSVTNFNNGLDNEPTDDVGNDIHAGLSFVQEALGNYTDALTSTDEVGTAWQFEHDSQLSFNDIILLRAICYYALADFSNSLIEVQILDPEFEADVGTEEGRAALAAKIEELRGLV